MLAAQNKISTRQAILLFISSIYSPAIRLFPQVSARYAGKAGWLTPIVAIIPLILLIIIVNALFKKNKNDNLSNLFFKILGKFFGRIVLSLYFIWILILLSIYVRYYAERILSSIMPHASIAFLIIVLLTLVFLASRAGLVSFARANEIFFVMFILVFILIFIGSIPLVKVRNLMLVSYQDAWPVIKASFGLYGIYGYFFFIFFLGDQINDKEKIKHFGLQAAGLILFLSILLLIMTIGALGSIIASQVSLPFFTVVKNISVLDVIERIESILLSIWVISDFVIITLFTLIAATQIKSLFNLADSKSAISPIILFIGIGSMYLFKDRFELETFSTIALIINVLFLYTIPVIIFAIGKLRKVC